MKLKNKEITPRLTVTLDKSFKNDEVLGVMKYGEDNDYPQKIEKLILGSQTAMGASNALAKFVAGEGFENEEIGQIVVGTDNKGKDVTLDAIRKKIAFSVARYRGSYIHCNMNVDGVVSDTSVIPFKNCRLSKTDDLGFSAKVGVSSEWANMKRSEMHKVGWYYNFNTKPNVLRSNIADSGGWDKFKGQIYSLTIDDEYIYPLSTFDSVYLDCDTEAQIQIFKNNEIRNGMSDKVVMMFSGSDDESENEETEAKIKDWIGPAGDKLLIFQAEFDEDTGELADDKSYKTDVIKTNINDKLFVAWETSCANNIRKSAHALPAVLIDYEQGGLSQASGEMLDQAFNYYNAVTEDIRTSIEDCIKDVYSNFNNEILRDNINWKIKHLSLNNGTTTDIPAATND